MEIDEFAQPEVAAAVAVTAIIASPSVRKTLRKGAAYGLAGVLLAGDATHKFVNAIAKGVRHEPKAATSILAVSPGTADGAVDV